MKNQETLLREVRRTLDFLGDTGLADVKFNLTQVQSLTGIKKGRIQYWTDSGYVRGLDNAESGRYHYTPEDVRKILLIEQLRDSEERDGYSLEAAAQKVEELLNIDNEKGAVAMLLLMRSLLEQSIDELTDKLADSGLAEEIIDVLRKDEVEGKNVETEGPVLDKRSFLQKARLPIGEVSRLVQVTPRQVRYWINQGYVSSESDNPYRFGFRSIQKINLISNFLRSGSSLEDAASKAEQVLDSKGDGVETCC